MWKKQKDYAIFLPSTSTNFVKYSPRDKLEGFVPDQGKAGDRLPELFEDGANELCFYRRDSGSFFYGAGLYSIGHANMDVKKAEISEKMIYERDKDVIILGDSGGYQISTGVIKGMDWENMDPKNNIWGTPKTDKLRLKILRWLEHTADYSMILDYPTGGIKNPNMPIETFRQCLEGTLDNCKFFIKHRKEGATNFLNVLQGRNPRESDEWYEAVKGLPFEGWAFGGANAQDFEVAIRRFIQFRDEQQINEHRNWIHILGNSRLTAGCGFTTIMRMLRKQVSPNITISYDSSSPYKAAANGKVYTNNIFEGNKRTPRFSYVMEFFPDDKNLSGSDSPFPFQDSPIGKKLKVGDICYKGHEIDSSSSWDTYSYIFLMAHNTYMQIQGHQTANRLYDLPTKNAIQWVPKDLLEFRDLCVEIFESEKPIDLLEKHRKLITRFTGRRMGHKINSIEDSELFSWEDDTKLAFDTDNEFFNPDDPDSRDNEFEVE